MPLSFIASAGTACLVEGEDEKIKIIQSPTWDELESSIASVQAVFNKRLVQSRRSSISGLIGWLAREDGPVRLALNLAPWNAHTVGKYWSFERVDIADYLFY